MFTYFIYYYLKRYLGALKIPNLMTVESSVFQIKSLCPQRIVQFWFFYAVVSSVVAIVWCFLCPKFSSWAPWHKSSRLLDESFNVHQNSFDAF